MVTMRDIAEAANVDRSAVSAVLNGHKRCRVSEEKRELILSLAKKMNYSPNLIARSLVSQKSHSIGVLLCSPQDRSYADLMDAFQNELSVRDYIGHFAFWHGCNDIKDAYDTALGHRVAGIVTCHSDVSLLPPGIPAVILGSEQPGTDCFYFDWIYIYRQYMHYLTSLGHKRIMFFGDYDSSSPRKDAFRKVAEEFDCVEPDFYHVSSNQYKAFHAAKDFFATEKPPTAIIAVNDAAAIGVINAALAAGLRVPEDLSVIGYDNIAESRCSFPPLTTSGKPFNKLVREILDVLFYRIKNPDMPPQQIPIRTKIILRDSCAPAKK